MKTIFDTTREIKIIPGYEEIFEALLTTIAGKPITAALGEELKTFAVAAATRINTNDFLAFTSPYTRNFIGKDARTGWEMLVMGWRKGDRTAIHGHPLYAGYTGIAGNVLLEVFEKVDGGLKKVLEHVVQPGESFYSIGEVEDYENHIHRLTGLTDTAFTLHIYSDDARKGVDFTDFTIVS
ncbi:MAG: hypothetical protein LBP56_03630 [Odoribacteraceae bacterium]|jgi:hypothetical protein|nr:hypothetical protein [Odoribacteraceae bacterium]